jgi:hypothetical protein
LPWDIAESRFERRLPGSRKWNGDLSTELRRAVLRAQAACKEAGFEVETLWEACQRKRKERHEQIQCYAAKQKELRPRLTRPDRMWVASITSIILGILIVLFSHTIPGVICGVFCGLMVFEPIEFHLTKYFPTPGVLVANYAWFLQEPLILSDIWPLNSDDYKDYVFIYRIRIKIRKSRAILRTAWGSPWEQKLDDPDYGPDFGPGIKVR